MGNDFVNIREYVNGAKGKLALLVGNGLSIKIWDKFSYASLLEEAVKFQNGKGDLPLKLFEVFQTKNFEEVLKNIEIGKKINRTLGYSLNEIEIHAGKIKDIFISTLEKVHPLPFQVSTKVDLLVQELKSYQRVYTTNYDLLIYWAINFDQTGCTDRLICENDEWKIRTDDYPGRTHVYFLHGALHIYENETGNVGKYESDDSVSLLDEIRKQPNRYSIYVAEGESRLKIRKINSNPYLFFCYETLKRNLCINSPEPLPLIIFGNSLRLEYDQHIVDAINNSTTKTILYGIFNKDEYAVTTANIRKVFISKDVYFYDSDDLFRL